MDIDGAEDDRKWEWRFALVLEDASDEKVSKGEERAKMTVYVVAQDAEFLLKLDAEKYVTSPFPLITLSLLYMRIKLTFSKAFTPVTALSPPSARNYFSSGVISKNVRPLSGTWRSLPHPMRKGRQRRI